MDKAHQRNSLLFYIGLSVFFALSLGSMYFSYYVNHNFRQFEPADEMPKALDLYLHNNQSK